MRYSAPRVGGRAQDQPWGLCLLWPNSSSLWPFSVLSLLVSPGYQPGLSSPTWALAEIWLCPPPLEVRWLGLPLKCSPNMALTHSGLPGYTVLCHPFWVNPWLSWKLECLYFQSMLAHGPLSGQVLNVTKWYQISSKLVRPNMDFYSSFIQSWHH